MIEQDFLSTRVIAISRGAEGAELDKLVRALYEGGIKLAEVTLNSPGALKSISRLREIYDGKLHIGAGTVLNLQAAKEAAAAGAEFIVTPNIDKDVISYCISKDLFITPGALTPTELIQAMNYGSRYIKMFPAGAMGAGYLKDVFASLSEAKIIAVGGINTGNAGNYLTGGAIGLGVGGSLCRIPADGNYKRNTEYAKELLALCGSKSR